MAGMIGYTEFFGVMALVGLPCVGGLIATTHHRPLWMGLGLGSLAFIAFLSGWLLALMVKDWLDRNKYPNRAGIGGVATGIVVAVFTVSAVACTWLFVFICAGG